MSDQLQKQDPPPAENEGAMPLVFDEWLGSQDEPIKALISTRFQALETTVRATRDERDSVTKQLKELSRVQVEGSEAKKNLEATIARLETTEKRAAFLEDALKPEIQCRNAKAAWIIAQAQELFDRQGRPDWAKIKAEAPELFGTPAAKANAGNGTGEPPPSGKDMNKFIRASAGRT